MIINAYQLWKSKLVFTLAERRTENGRLVPLLATSVESQITVDALSEKPSCCVFFFAMDLSQPRCSFLPQICSRRTAKVRIPKEANVSQARAIGAVVMKSCSSCPFLSSGKVRSTPTTIVHQLRLSLLLSLKLIAFDIFIQGSTFAEMPVPQKSLRDPRTILFQTPPCPLLPNDQNVTVFVVLKHESVVVARFNFDYVTREPRVPLNERTPDQQPMF